MAGWLRQLSLISPEFSSYLIFAIESENKIHHKILPKKRRAASTGFQIWNFRGELVKSEGFWYRLWFFCGNFECFVMNVHRKLTIQMYLGLLLWYVFHLQVYQEYLVMWKSDVSDRWVPYSVSSSKMHRFPLKVLSGILFCLFELWP